MARFDKSSWQQVNHTATLYNELVNKYKIKFDFYKKNAVDLLDIGCGAGHSLVYDFLLLMPKNLQNIVGVDKFHRNVFAAQKRFKKYAPRLSFKILDIEKGYLKSEMADYITSFWGLNTAHSQREAFKNMYIMLKENGCILLVYVIKSVIINILNTLLKTEWKEVIRPEGNFSTTRYQNSSRPEKEIRAFLEEAGFVDIDINVVKKQYVYTNYEMFKASLDAVHMIGINIPTIMRGELYKFVMEKLKSFKLVTVYYTMPMRMLIKIPVTEVTVFAKKPIAPPKPENVET